MQTTNYIGLGQNSSNTTLFSLAWHADLGAPQYFTGSFWMDHRPSQLSAHFWEWVIYLTNQKSQMSQNIDQKSRFVTELLLSAHKYFFFNYHLYQLKNFFVSFFFFLSQMQLSTNEARSLGILNWTICTSQTNVHYEFAWRDTVDPVHQMQTKTLNLGR